MVLLKTLITAGFEKMWLNCHIDIGSQHLGLERITWIFFRYDTFIAEDIDNKQVQLLY